MKYLYTLLLLIVCNLSYSQVLGKQYYNSTPRTYVAPPTSARIQAGQNAESRYLANRKKCWDLEYEIRQRYQSLNSEEKNIKYREGLAKNLKKIEAMKEEKYYGDYTLELDEIENDLRLVELLKEAE